MYDVRLAKSGGRFDKRIQDGLQVERRTTDDLEHIGSRRLLLQRFAQFAKQPRVLDRDDSLSGEVFNQLDLVVGERTHILAIDIDHAKQRLPFA